jgi:prepilin-type N-terminal cleavage/methylation domain-containing protein
MALLRSGNRAAFTLVEMTVVLIILAVMGRWRSQRFSVG